MTGRTIYGAVIQAATAVTLPGMSRHTKLLEPGLTQTKQTIALTITRHKTETRPNAISLGSYSAGLAFVRHSAVPLACPARPACPEPRREPRTEAVGATWVARDCCSTRYKELLETSITRTKQTAEAASTRYKTGTRLIARQRFLIGTPKRLKTALTQTKQISEVISNRYKKGGSIYSECRGGASAHSASRPWPGRPARFALLGDVAKCSGGLHARQGLLYLVLTSAGVERTSRTLRSSTARVIGFGRNIASGSRSSRCVEPV